MKLQAKRLSQRLRIFNHSAFALILMLSPLHLIPAQARALIPRKPAVQPTGIENCMKDMCGSTLDLLAAAGKTELAKHADASVKKTAETTLAPMINQSIAADLMLDQKLLISWSQAETLLDPSHLNESQRILMTMLEFSSMDWSHAQPAFEFEGEKLKVNRKLFSQLMKNLEPSEALYAADYFEAAFNGSGARFSRAIDGMSLNAIRQLFNTPSDFNSTVASAVNFAAPIRLLLGPMSVAEKDIEIANRVQSGKDIEPFEEKRFLDFFARTFRLSDYFAGDVKAVALQSKISFSQIQKIYQPRIDQMQVALNTPDQLSRLKKQVIAKCTEKTETYLMASPTVEEIQSFQPFVKKIQAAAAQTLSKYLSGTQLTTAARAVLAAKFQVVRSRNENFNLLNSYLKTSADIITAKANIKNPSASDAQSILLMQLMNLGDGKEGLYTSLFQQTDELCKTLMPPDLTDKAFTSLGSIVVSWQSIRWPKLGAGILAHELGHVASASIKKNEDLREPLACMQANHNSFYKEGASTNGENAEEDWADTFSISVQKELKIEGTPISNLGCLLIDVDPIKKSFSDGALDVTKDSTENHSSGIFRALRFQKELFKLPRTCELAIPATYSLNNCGL